jgi:hypothetical protein
MKEATLEAYWQVTQSLHQLMLEEHSYLSACTATTGAKPTASLWEPGSPLATWIELRRNYLEHLAGLQQAVAQGYEPLLPGQRSLIHSIEQALLQMLVLNKENEQLSMKLILRLYQPGISYESQAGFTKATVLRSYTAHAAHAEAQAAHEPHHGAEGSQRRF